MNVWAVITMIAVVAVLYVVIPVVLATRRHFRTYKLVRCPVLGVGAGVLMSRAGLAEALGWPALRRVADCTYWPRHRACAQGCRLAPDEEVRDYRQPLA
jgi:hypothetical protein